MILSAFIISGCSNVVKENSINDNESRVVEITAEEAKEEIEKGNVVILDVRTKEEYESGHIENSILIPLDEIKVEAENILNDKDKKILVYCRSGNRSATAANLLVEMGYNNIYDFCGIKDWTYEIVK
ncbi:MAG: rhodanese-like domain-containing protein [Clostridium sp.]|nr:rhodanese-like domain-containing protein [Clostridium sp.]